MHMHILRTRTWFGATNTAIRDGTVTSGVVLVAGQILGVRRAGSVILAPHGGWRLMGSAGRPIVFEKCHPLRSF